MLSVALWGREAPLAYLLLFTLTILGAPVLVSLLVYGYFRAVDAIAWVFDGRKAPFLWPTWTVELRLARQRAQDLEALEAIEGVEEGPRS